MALAAWLLAALLALVGRGGTLARALLGLGGVALLGLCLWTLPEGLAPIHLALGYGPAGSIFQLPPDALWLMGFGLAGAILASWLGTPAPRQGAWIFGVAASLIGALGVFGLQDAASFLVAWEIMSSRPRGDDPRREPRIRRRAPGSVHAGFTRSWRGRVVETERELAHEASGQPYFVTRLIFTHDVAPIFGPYLFAPLEKMVIAIAARLRIIQSGHLNFYLALIGALLVIILIITLV